MSHYVPANSRPPASAEYVAVPGYLGGVGIVDMPGQKKIVYGAVALAAVWFAWKKLKK